MNLSTRTLALSFLLTCLASAIGPSPAYALMGDNKCIVNNLEQGKYISEVYFENPDFTGARIARYVKSINYESFGPSDDEFAFEYYFDIYPSNNYVNTYYFETDGKIEIYYDGVLKKSDQNGGPRRTLSFSVFELGGSKHSISIRNVHVKNTPGVLHVTYKYDGFPDIYTPFEYFPLPVNTDLINNGGSIQDVTAIIGSMAKFDVIQYDTPSAETDIQWQRKSNGQSFFSNYGAPTKSETLEYGPVTAADEGTQFRALFTNRSCQLIADVPYATLYTKDPPPPTPVISCKPDKLSVKPDEDVIFTGAGGDSATYEWSSLDILPAPCKGCKSFTGHYISSGTKTVKLYAKDVPTPAVCTVEVSSAPTNPDPLTCSPLVQTRRLNENANFAADGKGPYYWSAPSGSPTIGTTYSESEIFQTKFDKESSSEIVKVTNDNGEENICEVSITDTPIFACAQDFNAVEVGESVTFRGIGGDPSTYKWYTNYATPKSDTSVPGKSSFATKFTEDAIGLRSIKLESAGESPVYCRIEVKGPPPPSKDPNKIQAIEAYAYDHSPANSGDCSQIGEKYETPFFPLECSPHKLPDPNPISFGSKTLRLSDLYGLLIAVTPQNPADVTELDKEGNPRGTYESIFKDKTIYQKRYTQVAAVNAYQSALNILTWFKGVWPDSEPLPYRLGPAFSRIFPIYINLVQHEGPYDVICEYVPVGFSNSGMNIQPECAIENNIVEHELGHGLNFSLVNTNKLNQYQSVVTELDQTNESKGLNEGLADYYALATENLNEKAFLGTYAFTRIAVDPKNVDPMVFRGLSYGPVASKYRISEGKVSDTHDFGAGVAYYLLTARNHIAEEYDDTMVRIFDEAVIVAWQRAWSIITEEHLYLSGSLLQIYYTELLRHLQFHREASGFPDAAVQYFKDLLYDEVNIGVIVGNTEDFLQTKSIINKISLAKACNDTEPTQYIFGASNLNAIDEYVTSLKLVLTEKNSGNKQEIIFDATSPIPLVQANMHTPITYFAVFDLDKTIDSPFRVKLTVTASNGKENSAFSGVVITPPACK